MNKEDAILLVENAIKNGELCISKLSLEVVNLKSMSSPKFKHFLNNICSNSTNRYLEIGTYRGGTFVSALYNNKMDKTPVAIDDFSEFFDIDNYHKKNSLNPRDEFKKNVKQFLPNTKHRFIDYDCFSIDLEFINTFDIYLYDGNHSEESHEKAIVYFESVLSPICIYIVDDWDMEGVKSGTLKGLRNWNILKHWKLEAKFDGDMENWWNGIGIFVLEKKS